MTCWCPEATEKCKKIFHRSIVHLQYDDDDFKPDLPYRGTVLKMEPQDSSEKQIC